jgi:hypothetical protein
MSGMRAQVTARDIMTVDTTGAPLSAFTDMTGDIITTTTMIMAEATITAAQLPTAAHHTSAVRTSRMRVTSVVALPTARRYLPGMPAVAVAVADMLAAAAVTAKLAR